jgi:2-oxoglutarate dehydrogenase E2 component (dihydrolipoamide succinyltransferase)
MARVDVIMPQMGESIAEGTILRWLKKVGDRVAKDETLLEISTDKVDSEIPSPASGVLLSIEVPEQKTVPVRTVIATIETERAGAVAVPGGELAAPGVTGVSAAVGGGVAGGGGGVLEAGIEPAGAGAGAAGARGAGGASGGRFYSPLVLTIAKEEGVGLSELEQIPGSGEGGRVTKKDLLAYVERRRAASGGVKATVAVPGAAAGRPGAAVVGGVGTPVDDPALRKKYPSPAYEVLQMSPVVQRMAQHMVLSVQTSPHVAAVHEVDMTAVVKHRGEHAAEFERREGFKLTYTSYIAGAVVKAIKKYPLVNSSVEGERIIQKNFINLGLAVASESGLIVPVIKHAEEKSLVGLARAVNDLAVRTRARKLTPDDIQGGTFTITNFGVFGTMIGVPIINQPQVAILGTGAITRRPVVTEDDAIAIRSIAYFTLSFDHRIIDGALGGMFLEEIVQNLERFDGGTKL